MKKNGYHKGFVSIFSMLVVIAIVMFIWYKMSAVEVNEENAEENQTSADYYNRTVPVSRYQKALNNSKSVANQMNKKAAEMNKRLEEMY